MAISSECQLWWTPKKIRKKDQNYNTAHELDKMDAICKAALRLVFGLHQFDCHAEILFAECGLLPVTALISAAKLCWKVRLSNMSAERFSVAVDSIKIPGQTDTACKKGEDFC